MTRFRKKPVVIEAFQMTRERRWDNSEWPNWLHEAWNGEPGEGTVWISPVEPKDDSLTDLVIGTMDGVDRIVWDNWIIRGLPGELYGDGRQVSVSFGYTLALCDPFIFKEIFEPVEVP